MNIRLTTTGEIDDLLRKIEQFGYLPIDGDGTLGYGDGRDWDGYIKPAPKWNNEATNHVFPEKRGC